METRRQRARDDDGQVLVMALIVITVIALILAAILASVEANTKTTPVVESRAERRAATDAAIEYGLKQVDIDPTLCASATPTEIPTPLVNDRPVTLTCESIGGDGLGSGGYAIVTYEDFIKSSGGEREVAGKIFVTRNIDIQPSNKPITVRNGSVFQRTCPASQPAGLVFIPSPPFHWECTTAATPDVPHVLPTKPAAAAPFSDTVPSCTGVRVHYPGTYEVGGTPLDLSGNDYFVSGIYYLNNLGTLSVNKLIAGNPRSPETSNTTASLPAGCGDTVAGGGSGFGALLILGGNTSFAVGNNNTLEVFRRYYGVGDSGYTERVSLLAVDPTTDATDKGYAPTTAPKVIATSGGQPTVSIHGLIYARTSNVDLQGPVGGTVAQEGVIAKTLDLKASAGGDGGLEIRGRTGSHVQRVLLKAVAKSDGEADVISTAKAEYQFDESTDPATIAVQSRRTE